MERFATIVNWFYLLTFVEKLSIFDVCGVPGYSSEYLRYCKWKKNECSEIQFFVNLVNGFHQHFGIFFKGMFKTFQYNICQLIISKNIISAENTSEKISC